MRLCLVSREFVPFWGAGIGTYAAQMAAAWGAAGHEVHVVCPDYDNLKAMGAKLYPGVRFSGVNLRRAEGVLAWDAYRFPFMRRSMGVYLRLLDLHAERPFDYIEFPEYWGEGYFSLRGRQTLGQFAGAVLGVRLHTPTWECRELNRDAWLNDEIAWLEHIEDESMRLADVLVSPTRSLLKKVVSRLGLENKPAQVVPYPFDTAAAAQELGRSTPAAAGTVSQGHSGNGQLAPVQEVLYFGRIEHRKGIHTFLDAAQRLLEERADSGRAPNLQFRLVGGDTPSGPSGRPMLAHARKLVREKWRNHITFEPARPREQLGALIQSATVCCFPSLWENFPNACLEAMTLGAAVVGSDAGGMAEIIEHGTSGLLFRAGDPEDLARALRSALTDQPLRTRLSEQAPKRVESLCDPATIVREMERLVEQRSPRNVQASASRASAPAQRNASPLLSIIIPHYNLAPYLPETLASVRAQTFTDYEIILVDDGSTDEASRELIAELEKSAGDRFRIIRKLNGGLSSARNAGLAAARGKWIVPLDADDLLEPAFLETMLRAADRNPGIAYATSLVAHFENMLGDVRAGWIPLGLDRDILAYRNCASCCTALIDAQTLSDVGGYDEFLTSFEDWDLYCRFAARGLTCAIVPEFLISYRIRPESMLRTEGTSNRARLRAYLYQKHAGLSERPDRTQRLQLADVAMDAEARAHEMIAENIRYRVADRLNVVLKSTRLQGRLKDITTRLTRHREAE